MTLKNRWLINNKRMEMTCILHSCIRENYTIHLDYAISLMGMTK